MFTRSKCLAGTIVVYDVDDDQRSGSYGRAVALDGASETRQIEGLSLVYFMHACASALSLDQMDAIKLTQARIAIFNV